ncbi:hypothetical protein HanIR_Chr17g0882121 [Helianthus annuus]|nr:hypothetical protein HanIR_Chr17g0882121 [Helianthus annuus]
MLKRQWKTLHSINTHEPLYVCILTKHSQRQLISGSFYTPSLSISFAIIYTQTKHDKLENSLSSQNKKKRHTVNTP